MRCEGKKEKNSLGGMTTLYEALTGNDLQKKNDVA